MIPISDQSTSKKGFPLITVFLILINIVIFFNFVSRLEFFVKKFGFVPQSFLNGENWLNLFWAMFLHGSFLHLLGNMWFLWIFGDNVELKIGKKKFLFLYFLSGMGAFLFHLIFNTDKTIPVIGASGAISGILGAYLILFPSNKVLALFPFFFFYRLILLPASIYIGLWFLFQFLYMGTYQTVAWWAHIGGFASGILFAQSIKKGK